MGEVGETLHDKVTCKPFVSEAEAVHARTLEDHIDDFNTIILDLENIEIKVEDEDQALLLLRSYQRNMKISRIL